MTIRILSSGIVEYMGERDGQRWRTTLAPGDTEQAEELLSESELADVLAAWTPEVLAQWAAIPAPVPRQRSFTPEQKILELEEALHELATTGKVAPERLTKLRGVAKAQGKASVPSAGGSTYIDVTEINGFAQVITRGVTRGVFVTGVITNAVPQTIFINQGILNKGKIDITSDAGANALRFYVNANGELAVIRQAGSSTWTCALRLVWK